VFCSAPGVFINSNLLKRIGRGGMAARCLARNACLGGADVA